MKSQKIIFTVIICIILLPLIANLGMMEETDEVNIVFYVNFLSPNDSPARCGHWGLLMENTLPKIGIGIEFHESTGWDVINVRINNNPILDFSYIPTYNEGGYDIFFNKFYWDLDPEIEGMFDSSSLTPYGRNFYQYLNPNYDAKLNVLFPRITKYAVRRSSSCKCFIRSSFVWKERYNNRYRLGSSL
ncbi:MAG: hypothetical protein ACTSPF_02920 [Candidatus Heimdallarchaeaceae archaeon]